MYKESAEQASMKGGGGAPRGPGLVASRRHAQLEGASGVMKVPFWSHCMSRMRRMDWIWGWKADHSFQCRKSPVSKRYW